MTPDENSIISIELAKKWSSIDPNPTTSSYVKNLIELSTSTTSTTTASTSSRNELCRLFPHDGSRIGFGTAGLRGAMKPGPLGMNDLVIIQATQGLASYCKKTFQNHSTKLLAIVGYDHRANTLLNLSSQKFALLTKLVFLQAGFDDCILFHGYVPTPLVAFATKYKKATVGIMITASHNPRADNGYKVYWNDGCQIRPPLDDGIANAIVEEGNLIPWVDYTLKMNEEIEKNDGNHSLNSNDLNHTIEIANAYYDTILRSGLVTGQYKLHDTSTTFQNTNNNPQKWTFPKFMYTPMHGVGLPWAKRSYETFSLPPFQTVSLQELADCGFPTVSFPNPEEKGALSLAMQAANEHGCDVVLANDPDADRLAVAEKCRRTGVWTSFSGDQIGVLLGHWLWENIGKHSDKPIAMCVSAVSSNMLSAIAETEGFYIEETLTGFKWIGSRAHELSVKEGYRVIFGYEEAIGFCCGDVIHDKDGISALGVISELIINVYSKGMTLSDHMQSLYNKYGEFCSNNGYYFCYDPSVISRILNSIRNGGAYMTQVGPYEIDSIRDLGKPGFDSTTHDKKPTLPTSASSPMITLRFKNNCVAQFRASGTEPKFKYYIEMRGQPGVSIDVVKKELDVMSKFILNELLQPIENGLVPP